MLVRKTSPLTSSQPHPQITTITITTEKNRIENILLYHDGFWHRTSFKDVCYNAMFLSKIGNDRGLFIYVTIAILLPDK